MTLNSAQVRKTLRRNKKRVICRARRTYAALRAPGAQAVPVTVVPPPRPVTQAPAKSKAASPPVPPWLLQARQHGRERRWDSAIAAYERGLPETPDDPALLRTLGQLHLKLRHLDDAARYLRAALDRDPESSEAYFMTACGPVPAQGPRLGRPQPRRDQDGSGDEALLHLYVTIPPHVTAALKKHRTQHSDIIRLALLERYGGVWFDATCLVTEPLQEWLPDLERRVLCLHPVGALHLELVSDGAS